ncbi:hypothetical protein Gogos_005647 [Gossypium gossypioides]|uniref:DUF7705 domain-containing protein n=1 Tax=Gossypium gossypioides TaxID=34282 RepID=A0A7J9C374_GOSGO|nr:hypothetical protein [Gossypium gossypioides]
MGLQSPGPYLSKLWIFLVCSHKAKAPRTWDPGTKPARRIWSSINIGTEIYVSRTRETAEWSVSDFDVLLPEFTHKADSSSSY